jgi:hypothetical protein
METTPIIWADNDIIESAESGDIVGNVRWFGVEYNVIKVIRTWQGNVSKYTWTHYWLDKNLHVYDFIKNIIDWGEASDEEIRMDMFLRFGIRLAEGNLGTIFHNSLMATEGYSLYMHPQFELGDMAAYGFSFNNGNNGWPDLKTWNALDFKPLPGKPFDKNLYHYWVDPPMVTGVLSGILSKYISMRTVDIKRATAPTWQNGFDYYLNYLYIKRFFGYHTNGIDYTKMMFTRIPDASESIDEYIEKEILDWIFENNIFKEFLEKFSDIFNLAQLIWLIYVLISGIRLFTYEKQKHGFKGGIDFTRIAGLIPYFALAIGVHFILGYLDRALEGDVNTNLFGLIRPKVRTEDYPELTSVESPPKNDPLFYGMGY